MQSATAIRTMFIKLTILFTFIFSTARAQQESLKCVEVNTAGYHYDALYKMAAPINGSSRIDLLVKTPSDAHIIFTSNPLAVLDAGQDALGRPPRSLEVVLGAGKNTWSGVRVVRDMATIKTLRSHTTADIMSPVEYRPFWIRLVPQESIEVGLGNSTEPFMTATARDTIEKRLMEPMYFGISSWNNVKAHWKINCAPTGENEISGIEETNLVGLAKLRRDITQFSDTSLPPMPSNGSRTNVLATLHIHHFSFNDRINWATLEGVLYLKWHDDAFVWDKESYDNVTSLTVQPTDVWTPDIHFFSDGGIYTEYGLNEMSASVVISNDGNVEWKPEFEAAVYCDVSNDGWPRDTHDCVVHLGFSYYVLAVYTGDTSLRDVALVAIDKPHWLDTGLVSNWNLKYALHSSTLMYYYVDLQFKRKMDPYTSFVITPFIGCITMGLSALWLPAHSKCRLHLTCLTCVLFTLLLTQLSRLVPNNASTPTAISMYVWGLVVSCTSVALFVVSSRSSRSSRSRLPPMPHWCSVFLHSPLLHLCLCLPTSQQDENDAYTKLKGDSTCASNEDWTILLNIFSRVLFLVHLTVYLMFLLKA